MLGGDEDGLQFYSGGDMGDSSGYHYQPQNSFHPQLPSIHGNHRQQSAIYGVPTGTMGGMTHSSTRFPDDDEFIDEAPLLEELGINFDQIWTKTYDVLMPSRISRNSMEDTDLAGPLCYCLLLGSALLLAGKVHFGYIYGFGLVGCLSIHIVLNLMSKVDLDIHRIISILGYCLLPIVLLSFVGIFVALNRATGSILALAAILWSTFAATRFVEMVFSLSEQRWLVAYPIFLLYSCFTMITIF